MARWVPVLRLPLLGLLVPCRLLLRLWRRSPGQGLLGRNGGLGLLGRGVRLDRLRDGGLRLLGRGVRSSLLWGLLDLLGSVGLCLLVDLGSRLCAPPAGSLQPGKTDSGQRQVLRVRLLDLLGVLLGQLSDVRRFRRGEGPTRPGFVLELPLRRVGSSVSLLAVGLLSRLRRLLVVWGWLLPHESG